MKSLRRVRSRLHRCYRLAFKAVCEEPGAEKFALVHGYIRIDGHALGHAWVDTGDGRVYDTRLDRHIAWDEYEAEHGAVIERRYPRMAALQMMLDNRSYGPWHTSVGIHSDDDIPRSHGRREWLKHNPNTKFPTPSGGQRRAAL
jgi:hypothetical protein